jgi:hypothetical protein
MCSSIYHLAKLLEQYLWLGSEDTRSCDGYDGMRYCDSELPPDGSYQTQLAPGKSGIEKWNGVQTS